jgi:hypothetical protein
MESMSDVTPYSISDSMGPVAMYGVVEVDVTVSSNDKRTPMSPREDKPALLQAIERAGLRRPTAEEIGVIMNRVIDADPMNLIPVLSDDITSEIKSIVDQCVKDAREQRVARETDGDSPRDPGPGGMTF